MDPITMALIGGGLGASSFSDKKKQQAHDRKVAAETARWSPWTGMQPQALGPEPSALGSIGSGALLGAQFGKQFGGEVAPADTTGTQNMSPYLGANLQYPSPFG